MMFLLIIIFAQSSTATGVVPYPHCSASERGLWIGSQSFADTYNRVSHSSLGAADKTSCKLVELFASSGLSPLCANCLGTATQRGRDHCFLECIGDAQRPPCRECFGKSCLKEFLDCTGALSEAELPQPAAPETTTPAPVRTRKIKILNMLGISSPVSTGANA